MATHNRIYGSAYYPTYQRDGIEYPGYDNSWVLGRERDTSFYDDDFFVFWKVVPIFIPRRNEADRPEESQPESAEPGIESPTHTHLYHDDYHGTPSYASDQYYPGSPSSHYPDAHYDHGAHLAWATEIPVRLRMTICCEGCKMKLDRTLRDMDGVHDVTISGWTHAMVTVTGTAPARKILKEAREVSKTAEFWSDSS